jgi:hypothetical protein
VVQEVEELLHFFHVQEVGAEHSVHLVWEPLLALDLGEDPSFLVVLLAYVEDVALELRKNRYKEVL